MTPHVLCIDVGSPSKIGWADSTGKDGSGADLASALQKVGLLLRAGRPLAIGFEAPIWTPRRVDLRKITGIRGGLEKRLNRAWSTSAGACALGTALALMPWSLTTLLQSSGAVTATTDLAAFREGAASLFVWEAFVSGAFKGAAHHDDARLAVQAFHNRWPDIQTDVPGEPAMNHAALALHVAGFRVDDREFGTPALVVGVS